MSKFRLAHVGVVVAALLFGAAAPLLGLAGAANAADTVRFDIGGPLQAAQNLMKSGKHKEALAKLREADGVAGKTAFEAYLIERVRASAAASAGDNDAAARAFEALIASNRLPAGEAPKYLEGLVGIYLRAKDYPKAVGAINRALKERDDPRMRAYLIQTYYAMGNYAQASKDLQAELRNEEKAGRTPSEEQLQLLANLHLRSGDKVAYVNAIEKLAFHYPKPSYWADLLGRVSSRPSFAGRLTIDVFRLKLANNLLKKSADYMELAQLALQSGVPAEAVKVVDKGYQDGALGTGAEAARHRRLKDLADKMQVEAARAASASEAALRGARDNDGLANLGYALVHAGQLDQGLAMMEQAIKSGGLKHPGDAALRLGHAYAIAGRKAQAIATLKGVGGADGAADLARYWIMAINHSAA